MKLWFVITPKGKIYFPLTGNGAGYKTRKAALSQSFGHFVYGGVTIEEVWADFKRDGYTVEKRRVI